MIAECLAGVKVLDLSSFLPGPFATLWLADLGAEVVKVEAPAGDPLRGMGPVDADGTSPFYKLANRNKSVVRLDLADEADSRRFTRLAAKADVLVDGLRPGALARLGFAPERLEALNPRLIQCALSGWGQTGPKAAAAGHDLTYLARAGWLAVTGPAERPLMPFPPVAGHAGAALTVIAILAALLRRGTTGRGTRLDLALSDAALSWMGGVLTMAQRGASPEREQATINGGAACYRVYPTACGRFMALAALEPKFWAAFCTAVGRPEWIHRQADSLPQTALIAEVEALFRSRGRDDWAALLAPVDCCCEPVLEPAEVAPQPQVQARGFLQTDNAHGLAEVLLPVLMDGARPLRRRPLIEDNADAVLAAWR